MDLNFDRVMSGENDGFEDIPADVAEGAVIENEAVEAAAEVEADAATLETFDAQTDELVADSDELEDTKEDLDEQLEDPNFEGIEEFAAEQLGRRIRAIESRRRVDFSGLGTTISGESFDNTINNRRRRTELAAEGLGDAVKSIWEKIKAAISAAINFVKEFFKKHISTVGRLIKALEKAGKKARDVKGAPDGSKEVKASGALQKAVYGTGSITAEQLDKLVKVHTSSLENAIKVINETTGVATSFSESELNNIISGADSAKAKVLDKGKFFLESNSTDVKKFGSKDATLVDGAFGVITTVSDGGDARIEVKWDNRSGKDSKDRLVTVASGSTLDSLTKEAIKMLRYTQQMGGVVDKTTTAFNKAMADMSKVVAKAPEDTSAEGRRALSSAQRILRDTVRVVPKISTKLASLNVRLGKVIVGYVNVSVSNYTTK